jgi:Cytochrome c oxidase biogenesis protein Cmc1 like
VIDVAKCLPPKKELILLRLLIVNYLLHVCVELTNLTSSVALRSKMKAKALKECDHFCEKYAQCASGRTLSVIWRCRKEANDLNECLHQ